MNGKQLTLALVFVSGFATVAAADKSIDDIHPPAKTAPMSSWTAVQQWMHHVGNNADPRSDYGYGNAQGALLIADELGDRLSALGRASLIEQCFDRMNPDTKATIAWAVCGPDVAALDLRKVEAELVAAGIGTASRKDVMNDVREAYDHAKKIGAAVDGAAKSDPGVAKILKAAAGARSEWAGYARTHRAAIDRYLALKDGVRSGKSNDKAFAGCYEATRPAFAKLVKSTKLPAEVHGAPMLAYVSRLTTTIDGYVTTVAYAACAWSQGKAGESIYVGAANRAGGDIRFGSRSLALSKILDPAFQPRFADRSVNFDDMKFTWRYGIELSGVSDRAAIMTPGGGAMVASTKRDGDLTRVTFKRGSIVECVAWKDTRKIAQISPNGTISYEKTCAKRGKVTNEASPVEVPTKYTAGIKPGTDIVTVLDFPVVVRKRGKLVAVLGVPK